MPDLQYLNERFSTLYDEMNDEVNELRKLSKILPHGISIEQRLKYEEYYMRVGSLLTDLSVYFFNYPVLTATLQTLKNEASERSMVETLKKIEETSKERYYSFSAMKDTLKGLESIFRTVLYRLDGKVIN